MANKVETAKSAGEAVKLLRKDRGLTQVELAKRSGVPQQTIQYIESNGGGSFEIIRRLARAMRVRLDTLDRMLPVPEPVDRPEES